MKPNNTTPTSAPDYDRLVELLRERFDDGLRWVASFDAAKYNYTIRYIRPNLKTELSSREFDIVVHRSMGLFRRPYIEEVYSHLGAARTLVVEHERATAIHLYLSDTEGVIIKVKAGHDVTLPAFTDDCLAALYLTADEP